MYARLAALATLALAAAAVDVLAPGPDIWWIADSQNVLVWDCHANDVLPTYRVQAANPNITLLTANTDIIAQLDNTECMHAITQAEVAPLRPGTGYTILLTNPINETDIIGQSQPFEVKPLGAAYSTVTATPAPFASGVAATTSANGAASTGAAERAFRPSGVVGAAAAAVFGVALGMAALA